MHRRLLTFDRMRRMGLANEDQCPFCVVAIESHEHLFFQCKYGMDCLQLVQLKCGVCLPSTDWEGWWRRTRFRSIIRKKVTGMMLCSLIYLIWWARNVCVQDKIMLKPGWVVQKMRFMVAIRVRKRIPSVKHLRHEFWLRNVLGILL
ncbi:hypothetical protein RND81_13G071100 [Saponaria officinalis]|uniref:Reverse transcriptase zinc-binding domain-containing protein n=1 Tax=Saponaria officinalis TaxID=3572 RepID=A0AAW1H3E5_SAPOF